MAIVQGARGPTVVQLQHLPHVQVFAIRKSFLTVGIASLIHALGVKYQSRHPLQLLLPQFSMFQRTTINQVTLITRQISPILQLYNHFATRGMQVYVPQITRLPVSLRN